MEPNVYCRLLCIFSEFSEFLNDVPEVNITGLPAGMNCYHLHKEANKGPFYVEQNTLTEGSVTIFLLYAGLYIFATSRLMDRREQRL